MNSKIQNVIKNFKCNKMCGSDGIWNKQLKREGKDSVNNYLLGEKRILVI